jgi:uncharacterized membrane protein
LSQPVRGPRQKVEEFLMESFIHIITIVSVGLMIGVELAVWAFINPILWRLEEPARTEAVRHFARRLGTAMPFWYVLNFLLLIFEAVVWHGHAGASLIGAAVGIWAAVIILTLLFLVPINNRLARGAQLNLEVAHREHARWHAMHRARVVALEAAMVLFLLAVN